MNICRVSERRSDKSDFDELGEDFDEEIPETDKRFNSPSHQAETIRVAKEPHLQNSMVMSSWLHPLRLD